MPIHEDALAGLDDLLAVGDELRAVFAQHGQPLIEPVAIDRGCVGDRVGRYTAVANAQSKIEERLARWLLMAHDRVDDDELPLTHEFLALMLGVRRPSVTVALNLLVDSGLIRIDRGVITIIDREGLEKSSNGAYGPPEAEWQRLFG